MKQSDGARRIWMEIESGERVPRVGDMIQTVTQRKPPSVYLIVGCRRICRRDPSAKPRYSLTVQVEEKIPEGMDPNEVWRLRWFSRKSKKGKG